MHAHTFRSHNVRRLGLLLLLVVVLSAVRQARSQGLISGPDETCRPRLKSLESQRLSCIEKLHSKDSSEIRVELGAILWQMGDTCEALNLWEEGKAAYVELFSLKLPPDAINRCQSCMTRGNDQVIQGDYERLLSKMKAFEDVDHIKFKDIDLPGRELLKLQQPKVTRIRRWGYIDKHGNLAIKPLFLGASEFSEGVANVEVASGSGFIDKAGSWAIPPGFASCGSFSEGLAFATKPGGQTGYIDRKGKFAIAPQFCFAHKFSEGLASVARAPGHHGFINHFRKFVIPPRFSDAEDFGNGLSMVQHNEHPAFIDRAGKIVSALEGLYLRILETKFTEGTAPVYRNGKVCFIDTSGHQVIPQGFSDGKPFTEGLARVWEKGAWHYIDRSGKQAFPGEFGSAEPFSDGVACVGTGKEEFIIDRFGRRLFSLKDGMKPGLFREGLAPVQVWEYVPL